MQGIFFQDTFVSSRTCLVKVKFEVDGTVHVCLNEDIKETGGILNEEGLCCDCIAVAIASI